MRKVTVVSAFVPIRVLHMSRTAYYELGRQMFQATIAAGAVNVFFDDYPLKDCWSYDLCKDLPPATETPADRYETPQDHVNSHIVQHTRTQWAMEAVKLHPDTDVIVWLDLGILKQGKWCHNPVTTDHVTTFVDWVARYKGDDMPFPGIQPDPDIYYPLGNNWRFCGSTHIWPVKYLPDIDETYRTCLRDFIKEHGKVPLDLAIWPMVEKTASLPFKFYQAEYDASQLTQFPRTP